jgi:hypothetical protein
VVLTLYLIEKDVQVNQEKHRNDVQQEQIDVLTRRLSELTNAHN